jgi:hypothetical protein
MEGFPKPQENIETDNKPEEIGKSIHLEAKWKRLITNKDIHKGVAALIRTVANVGISFADKVPVAGEVVSWGADAWKFVTPALKKLGLPELDLTPSVKKWEAVTTEAAEFIGFGAMPTHWVETIMQLKREDLPALKAALEAYRQIMAAEKTEYDGNKEKVDEAINTFIPNVIPNGNYHE